MNEMRKLMEAVRRINEGAETAYYFEHYPHYMGTKNSKFATDINSIDEIHDLYLAQKKIGFEDDGWYDKVQDIGDNYAFGDVIQNWPSIRRQLETKGVWADQWEEGSHGISMDSMRDAAQEVAQIEAKIKADEFDDEDEFDNW